MSSLVWNDSTFSVLTSKTKSTSVLWGDQRGFFVGLQESLQYKMMTNMERAIIDSKICRAHTRQTTFEADIKLKMCIIIPRTNMSNLQAPPLHLAVLLQAQLTRLPPDKMTRFCPQQSHSTRPNESVAVLSFQVGAVPVQVIPNSHRFWFSRTSWSQMSRPQVVFTPPRYP